MATGGGTDRRRAGEVGCGVICRAGRLLPTPNVHGPALQKRTLTKPNKDRLSDALRAQSDLIGYYFMDGELTR